MKIITDNFLKSITPNRIEALYGGEKCSPECKEQDKQMAEAAGEAFLKLLANKPLNSLYKEISSRDGIQHLTILALKYYYLLQYHEVRKRMVKELKLCEQLLKTDIIYRDEYVCGVIEMEKKKLESALRVKPVKYVIHYLNEMYDSIMPELTKTEKYIRISEFMHHLKLYPRTEFKTLEDAKEYVNKKKKEDMDYWQSAEKVIYDRITKYFKRKG